MAQQTAVDALIEKIKIKDKQLYYELLEELGAAKQLEKWQIENAFFACWKANMPDGCECKKSAVEYYNETYAKQ
jgi:hypothetical protein